MLYLCCEGCVISGGWYVGWYIGYVFWYLVLVKNMKIWKYLIGNVVSLLVW